MKPLKLLGWTLKIGTLLSSFGFVITVSIQIFARYFLENVPAWTEEASRILFIYAIAFASGLAYRGNYFVQLDLFSKKKNPKLQQNLNRIIPLLVFLLFGVMGIYAIKVVEMGRYELSPSLQIPMIFPFFSLLILTGSICIYAAINFLKQLKK